jgi:hypothetical protein
MIKKYFHQIIQEICTAPTRTDKINMLRHYDEKALRGYLKMAFDRNLEWELPGGAPPFKPCNEQDVEFVLRHEFRRMYIFLRGGQPNLQQKQREALFVTLLESMNPKDAEFLVNVVKDKKIPPGIDAKLIRDAWPDW